MAEAEERTEEAKEKVSVLDLYRQLVEAYEEALGDVELDEEVTERIHQLKQKIAEAEPVRKKLTPRNIEALVERWAAREEGES